MNLNKIFTKTLQAYGLIIAVNRLQEFLPNEGSEHVKITNSQAILSQMLENKLQEITSDINKQL